MKRHPKLKALLCLTGTFLAGLIILTIIYWLLIYPLTQESTFRIVIMVAWIFGGCRLCYWLLTRYTPWGRILEDETEHSTKK